jgi:hypothetical protein
MPWEGVFKTEKNRFYPDKPVTREELCILAYQLAKAPEVPALEEDGFEDLMDFNRLSPKAYPAIRWALQSGLLTSAFEETPESLSISGLNPQKPVKWEQALRALEPILISIGQVEESGK